jgi:hypothetical protein
VLLGPTIIVTQETSSSITSQPSSLIKTEYHNDTQVIMEEGGSSPIHTSTKGCSSGGGGSPFTLCGVLRDIINKTFQLGSGFIVGVGGGNPTATGRASSNKSNKRFFF